MAPDSTEEELADWRAAAHHEAGHAVCAVLLGGTLRSVSIYGRRGAPWDWSGETITCEEPEGTVEEILRLLAGPMAEAQFCGECGRELPREACRSEIGQARSMTSDIGQDYDDAKERAVTIVREHWPAIEALANRFENTLVLDGADATQVITSHV